MLYDFEFFYKKVKLTEKQYPKSLFKNIKFTNYTIYSYIDSLAHLSFP